MYCTIELIGVCAIILTHYTISKMYITISGGICKYKILLTIFVGILNMFYQDRGASAVFAKLSNALAKEYPEENLNQLHGLILGKTLLFNELVFPFFLS